MWSLLLGLVLYVGTTLYLSIKHNIRTTCRQMFVFHPWADAGGGGEKCLWLLIKAYAERGSADMQSSVTYQASAGRLRYKKPLRVTLFCHVSTPHVQDLLNQVDRTFGIQIPTYVSSDSIHQHSRNTTRLSEFVSLRLVRLYTASLAVKKYPVATQLLQLAAGFLVGFEASLRTRGNRYDAIWDTAGLPTSVAWFNWLTTFMRRRCYAYIHYPFLSRDVIYHSKASFGRRLYSYIIDRAYYLSGGCFRQPIIVNSTYTEQRLKQLWPSRRLTKVYPPIDLGEDPVGFTDAVLRNTTLKDPGLTTGETGDDAALIREMPFRRDAALTDKDNIVLSIAQFRPEKKHMHQIDIIKSLLERAKIPAHTRFLICGTCRPNSRADQELLTKLLTYAECLLAPLDGRVELQCHLKPDNIKWAPSHHIKAPKAVIEVHVNMATRPLRQLMTKAKVGLHTMVDEHLGISVAEMALTGCYVVAHNSGGPRDDILRGIYRDELDLITSAMVPSADDLEEVKRKSQTSFSGSLGCLCNKQSEFVDGVEKGLLDNDNTKLVQQVVPIIIRSRFPTDNSYGEEVLNAWNLYTQKIT
ncbi:putative glycosyl transferase [Gregarina niphandrodes]|uniref:Glycosyl transferase n=1 Tax=Gregarina niphandrodes TaxID=110365 RepID=A0A023B3Z9_GRENI|nr:putative glycosyl transferase [Gregarina niphandrodes]EZG56143.1 putative glycosyl transferase [Gregarina niphandrodes]|eukprot:XP_011131316.1 putative glycosyl transferase [Gregarina niphandrodes]